MSSTVIALHVTSSGVITQGNTRLRGFYVVPGSSAGSIDFRNGTTLASPTYFYADVPASTAPAQLEIPGDGIRFGLGIYAVMTGVSKATIFIEGGAAQTDGTTQEQLAFYNPSISPNSTQYLPLI